MSDLLIEAAGLLGIAAALVHGYLGETRILATAHVEPQRARRVLRGVLHCTVVDWVAMGALLLFVPLIASHQARIAIVAASVAVYGAAAIGNAWISRGRHFGWILLAAVVGLALTGM